MNRSGSKNKKRFKRKLTQLFGRYLGCHIIGMTSRLLRTTIKIDVHAQEITKKIHRKNGRIIYAFWHEHLGAVAKAGRIEFKIHRPIYAMISQSRDGDILAKAVSWLGIRTVRGSSTRGGTAALKKMIAVLENEGNVALAVDGPLGPRHTIHPGIFLLAKQTGAAIVPLTWQYENVWTFKSWDQAKLAKPFSKLQLQFHSPIFISKKADREEFEKAGKELEYCLNHHSTINCRSTTGVTGPPLTN